ncbi:MAG: FtsW/RodA/SpoVE family cell cycle protein [bacterium]|nr:FtsW/RodA/SpoVE family cell cycle protein [bacterium]
MRLLTEAAWVAGSAVVAGLGVALVDVGKTGQVTWAVAVVFLAFGCCLAGLVAAVRRWAPGASSFLLWPTALLVALGLVLIYRINPMEAPIQVWWIVAGVVAAIGILLTLRWGVERLMPVGYWLAAGGLGLIVLPFVPRLLGGESESAHGLWLTVGWGNVNFMVQPFGLGAVLLAVGLAGIHSRWALESVSDRGAGRLVANRDLLVMGAVWVTTLPLLWATGDLTAWAVLVVLSATIAYAATGDSRAVWTGLSLLGIGFVIGLTSSRMRETLQVWLDPFSAGEAGAGLKESLLALGSGHLSGSGLGMGEPELVPRATSDWILAALGEELGLAGTVAVIVLYGLVTAAGVGVSIGSRDLFSKVAAAALSFLLCLMFLAAAGGLQRLLPPTDLGLPFLAYGGIPLLAGWLAMALLVRISHEEQGPL